MKKEIKDYIKEYTQSEEAKKIINSSKITNDEGFNIWSFKKLIFLEYCIEPYLRIILNQGFKCFFIDLFSSSGANKTEEGKISLGSPIISILKGVIPNKSKKRNNRFNKWFFIDKKYDFCKALKSRVLKTFEIIDKKYKEKLELNKDVEIICGDCNTAISDIVERLKKIEKQNKIAILVFIDPYTFTNIKWGTWEKLLELKIIDIIFTFPIGPIRRGIKKIKNPEEYFPPSLNEILKKKDIKNVKEFGKLYAKDIVNEIHRSIMYYDIGITVKNSVNTELYRIQLFTHSNIFSKICLEKAKQLDNLKLKHLKVIAEEKQKSISDFSKELKTKIS